MSGNSSVSGFYLKAFPCLGSESQWAGVSAGRTGKGTGYMLSMSGPDGVVHAGLTTSELLDLADALRHLAELP